MYTIKMSMEDFEAIKNLNSLIQNKIQETDKLISELNSEQVLLKEKQKQLEKHVSSILNLVVLIKIGCIEISYVCLSSRQ